MREFNELRAQLTDLNSAGRKLNRFAFKKSKMGYYAFMICMMGLLLFGSKSFAGNAGITYQGRILKPGGEPLEGSNVQFRLQIRTPNASSCLMYEEIKALDMRDSKGVFALTMNDGTGTRVDSSGYGIDRVFSNSGTFSFAAGACTSGSTYPPGEDDGRSLQVYFKDETMAQWEPMPPQGINFVPFAFESKQVQGFNAASLLRVQESGANGAYGNISPLSNAQYTELLSLVAGTSTQFGKPNTLGGRTVPTFNAGNAGQVLGWNGTDWVATTPSTNASTSTKLQSTADPALGVSFQVDPTIATNYTVTWPATAGGAGQTVTSNGFGVLSWVTPLTTTTGFAQGGNSFGAAAVIGTNDTQNFQLRTSGLPRLTTLADGKTGIGTETPSQALEVNGNILANKVNSADSIYVSANANISTPSKWLKVAMLPPNAAANGSHLDFEVIGGQPLFNEKYKMWIRMGSRSPFTAVVTRFEGSPISFSHGSLQVYDTGSGYEVYFYFKGTQNLQLGARITRTNFGSTGVSTLYPYESVVTTTPSGTVVFDSATATPVLSATNQGRVGVGVAPTAFLHTRPGSTTNGTAPFKLTSSGAGVLLASPEDGAMEYDGTGLWFTVGSNRYVISTQTASGTYSNAQNITNTAGSIRMIPSFGNSVIVDQTTASTTSATGALVVNGGVGVAGNINAAGNISSTGNMNLGATLNTGTGVSTGDTAIELGQNRTDAGNAYMDFHTQSGVDYNLRILRGPNPAGAAVITNVGDASSLQLTNTGNSPIIFSTYNSERARIAGDTGYFGIGAATPASRLHVAGSDAVAYTPTSTTSETPGGSAASTVVVHNRGYLDGNGAFMILDAQNTNYEHARSYIGSISSATARNATTVFGRSTNFNAYKESMRIDGVTGNVGIGTSNPAALLSLDTNGAEKYFTLSSGATNYVSIGNADGSSGLIHLKSGGTTRVSLDSRNGSSSFVGGSINLGSNDGSLRSKVDIKNSAGAGYFTVSSASVGDQFIVDPSGRVGIGTAAPTAALEVRGAVKTTDSTGATRLYGRGRPNTLVYGTTGAGTGLCTNGAVSFGLSRLAVSWEGADDSCPTDAWVCNAAERGTAACDTARPDSTSDAIAANGSSVDYPANTHIGWISEGSTSGTISGSGVNEAGAVSSYYTRDAKPVWCCY